MEQEEKKSVTIKINGNEYTIKGSSSPQYLKKVADYVDNIMKKLSGNNRHMSKDKLAILTSINLADEVLKLKDELQQKSQVPQPVSQQAPKQLPKQVAPQVAPQVPKQVAPQVRERREEHKTERSDKN